MNTILTLNPFIGVIIAWVAQLGVVIMLLLDTPNWNQNSEPKTPKWWIHQSAISFFTLLYLIISFLLIDIAVLWLVGSWSLADWRWQIPNVFFGLLTGSLYLYFLIYRAKSRALNFILFVIIAITIASILHVYAGQFDLMADALSQAFGIGLPILIAGGTITHLWVNTLKYEKDSQRKSTRNSKSVLMGSVVCWFVLFIQIAIFYDGNSILYIF